MSGLVLVGGGALAREIHDWFTPSLQTSGRRFVGYLQDGAGPAPGMRGLDWLGTIRGYRPDPSCQLVMAIGAPDGKAEVARLLLDCGASFATLLHPTAFVSATARLGRGVVVGLFGSVSTDAVLGDFSLVYTHASVAHDVELGEFSTLSGHVDLTGFVRVGRGTFFGTGARVLPRVAIGEACTIGAGAVVVRSVPDRATLYAMPARLL